MLTEKPLFKKEVLEKDALNRIKWDPSLKGKEKEFEIHYIDREKNELKKINFSEIELEGDFFRYGENLVPLHRIRKILWKGEVVWNKRKT